MQDKEKSIALTGAAAGLLAAMATIAGGYFLSVRVAEMIAESDALHTEGGKTRNALGETVALRGTGWYRESPEALGQRLGMEEAQRISQLCEAQGMTEKDLDAMKELGLNCVRLPVRYHDQYAGRNSRKANGGEIDFNRLERMVELCSGRGIYVIVALDIATDMQNSGDAGGQNSPAGLLDCTLDGLRYRNRIIELWGQIACRFKGNPAIAAYDLLGEPACGEAGKSSGRRQLWSFYDRLYRAVRAVDPEHIIMFETAWNTVNLPALDKYHWENVLYRLYGKDLTDAEIDAFIAGIGSIAAWRVPVLADVSPQSGIRDDLLSACNEAGLGWLAFEWKGVSPAGNGRFVYTADISQFPASGDSSAADSAKRNNACSTENFFKPDEAVKAALRHSLRPEPDSPTVQAVPASTLAPANPAETAESADKTALAPALALGVFTIAGSAAAGIVLKHRQKVLKPKTLK